MISSNKLNWVDSKKPTRIILITATSKALNHLHPQDTRVFEIAWIPAGFPFSNAHDPKAPIQEIESISILLIVNKESMMLDPFDWPALKKDFIRWANAVPIDLLIPEWTDKLFLERAFATQSPCSSICSLVSRRLCLPIL